MIKRLSILIMLLLVSSILVLAQSDPDNSNNPNENEDANACFEGGSMEGKCDTLWEWQCGWYLIRFESGLWDRDAFPMWCASIVPPEILPEDLGVDNAATEPVPVCVSTGLSSMLYIGIPNTMPNIVFYTDAGCVNNPNPTTLGVIVTANTKAEATTLCTSLFGGYAPTGFTDFFSLGTGYWECWLS